MIYFLISLRAGHSYRAGNPSRKWLKREWIDQYSGNRYRITTSAEHGTSRTARVKTFGDVLSEYEYHPEAKCADAKGKASDKQTIGLLQRRHIRIDQVKYIGKESNSLEEVEEGLIHSPENIYTEYSDPRRDDWEAKLRPALEKLPVPFVERETGLSRRMLNDAIAGRSRPTQTNQQVLAEFLRKLGAT